MFVVNSNKIIQEAKELISLGKNQEAYFLLRDEGYVKQLNANIQTAFLDMIPEKEELIREKTNSLKDLFHEENSIRIKTSRYIFKQACAEFSWEKANWLGDPRTIDLLFDALKDNEVKVVENITGALALISSEGRYFNDIRIFNRLIELIKLKNKWVVINAARGLRNYSFEEKWEYLLEALKKQKNLQGIERITSNFYIRKSDGKDWSYINKEKIDYLKLSLEEIKNNYKKDSFIKVIDKVLNWLDRNH